MDIFTSIETIVTWRQKLSRILSTLRLMYIRIYMILFVTVLVSTLGLTLDDRFLTGTGVSIKSI